MNSDLKKQAQALEVTFSRRKQNHISLRNLFQQYIKNLSESEFEFYHHIIERNAQMHIRSENLFY